MSGRIATRLVAFALLSLSAGLLPASAWSCDSGFFGGGNGPYVLSVQESTSVSIDGRIVDAETGFGLPGFHPSNAASSCASAMSPTAAPTTTWERSGPTTDGGASWTRQLGGAEVDAISFADPANGWATGFNNLVLHTTDGGATWTPQQVGAPPVTAITGVTAVDAATAWVAGWSGFVAVTRDGGETWRRERIAGAEGVDFEDAHFPGAQRGWVGGNIGIWKRTSQP